MENAEVDQFILDNLPRTFAAMHVLATEHFGQDAYRKVDARLQSLRKRGMIEFERVKGGGIVWSKT